MIPKHEHFTCVKNMFCKFFVIYYYGKKIHNFIFLNVHFTRSVLPSSGNVKVMLNQQNPLKNRDIFNNMPKIFYKHIYKRQQKEGFYLLFTFSYVLTYIL